MNEYFSRSERSQAGRATTGSRLAVPAVQPISTQQRGRQDAGSHDGKPHDGESPPSFFEDDLAGAAEYARVYARVVDILAELRSAASAATVEDAEAEIQSMVPVPMILAPLPPTFREVMESAVTLGKRIAGQARYAHAAQAHLRRVAVDQLLSIAA
ncbi:MAG TPA: hypothetical protein VF489_11855 [Sphingobium sp.]